MESPFDLSQILPVGGSFLAPSSSEFLTRTSCRKGTLADGCYAA